MRKTIIMALLCAVCALTLHAGDSFVPKPMEKVSGLVETIDKTMNYKIQDLFEYPDDIPLTDNLDNHGVTVTVTSDNESMMAFKSYTYYTYLKYNRVTLTRYKNVAGTANVTVTLAYNGDTVSTVIPHEYFEILVTDQSKYASTDNPCRLDILDPTYVRVTGSQQNVTKANGESTVKLEFVEMPEYGTLKQDTIHYDRFNTAYYRPAALYTPHEGLDNYTKDRFRFRLTLASGNYAEGTVEVLVRKNALVSRIIEFLPAPGQFTNEASFRDASCLIGTGSGTGTSSVPQTDGLVSLGGFGGYVIVGFDQPIYNDPQHPYGVDFTIGGNSFVADYKGVWTEPGAVMVSRDDNGNGVADDEWYELAGSDYWFSTTHRNIAMTYTDPAYNSRYTVPWTTDNGLDGALLTNQFHEQPYFPDPAIYPVAADKIKDGKLTYNGTLIRSSLDKRVPSYIEFYRCPAFGYCDNKTKQNGDLTTAYNPYYDDEKGKSTDGFDISWAVDKNGNYVDLDRVDFVKIYTAGAVNAGWLGEWSTEVTGVGISNPDPAYVPQDYYINYAGITQLQVPVGAQCQYEGLAFKNGRPISEGEPRWWVDDESIGTIDNTGLFTGKAIGSTVIHFQQYADAPADEFDVEVVAMTGVMIDIEGNASTVSNDSIACVQGETIYINVESLTQNKSQLNGTSSNRYIYDNYTWTNTNPEVGTIDNGTFKALKPGETLLTVYSGVDGSLSDAIKVTVLEIPEPELINNPIRVPYHAAKASYTNDKLFTTGNNARVNMLSLQSPVESNMLLKNNVLDVDFSSIEFGVYPVHFDTRTYGVDKAFDTSFEYYADNHATSRQLLAVCGGSLKGVATESTAVSDYDAVLASGDACDMVAQGAYVWVAKGASLTRYNVALGTTVAERSLTAAGGHKIALYADRLLATDGKHVRRYYKTDLEPCGEYVAGYDVRALAVDDDRAWVLTGNGVECIDIDRMVAVSSVEFDAASLSDEVLCFDAALYLPAAKGEDLALTIVSDGKASGSVCAGAVSSGVAVLDARSGRVGVWDSNGLLHWYDVSAGTWTEPVDAWARASVPVPVHATSDAADGRVYAASDKLYVLDFDGALINTVEINPEVMCLMDSVGNNVAPVLKALNPTTVYEYATTVSTSTRTKTGFCTDQEGSYDVYPRVTDDMSDWLQTAERLDNGNLRLGVKPMVTVDVDSLVYLPVECIDHAGASVMTAIPYKIMPRLYKPLIVDYRVEGTAETDFEHKVNLSEVFVNQGTATVQRTYKCTGELVGHTLPTSVDVSLNGDTLSIKAPAGTSATGDIRVNRTIAHTSNASYLPKTFSTVIPVNISATSGIDDVAYNTVRVYPNPATEYITIDCEGDAVVEVYALSGARVIKTSVAHGGMVNVAMLPCGTYVVRVNDGMSVRTAKLIKR